MKNNTGDLKHQIEDVFQADVLECYFERPFVLHATFQQVVDLSDVLPETEDPSGLSDFFEGTPYSQSIFNLSRKMPLIILSNAFIGSAGNANISEERDRNSVLQQDTYHSDYGRLEVATFLFKKFNTVREAPTYFAPREAVLLAVQKILSTQENMLERDVRRVLLNMLEQGFCFSVSAEKRKTADEILRLDYPAFSDDVFNLLPEQDRYAHFWRKSENIVTLHFSSKDMDILHARGASLSDISNKVKVYDVFPEMDVQF